MTLPRQHTIQTPYIIGSVHFYSAMLAGELTLFDCGPPTTECRSFLEEHFEIRKIQHVILTHGHIDHWGQARWLAEAGATVYIPFADHLKIQRHKRRLKEILELLQSIGLPDSTLQYFAKIFEEDAIYRNIPFKYKIVEEELAKHLGINIHSCPGHSTSDLVFEGNGWLISGDTLLEGIFQSPMLDIDLGHGGRFQNYQAWCDSLTKLARLEGKEVFPGHRTQPTSIHKTLLEYLQTMLCRTSRFLKYQDEENLMAQIDALLAGRIKGPFHIYLKASEIIFIKDFLKNPTLLKQSLLSSGLYKNLAKRFEKVLTT